MHNQIKQSACLNQVSVPRNEAAIFDIRISFMFVLLRGGLSISLIFLLFLCIRFLDEFYVFTPTIQRFLPTATPTFFDIVLIDAQIDYVYLNVLTNKSLKPSNSGNLSYTFSTSKSLQLNLESYVSTNQTKRTALQAVGFDIG